MIQSELNSHKEVLEDTINTLQDSILASCMLTKQILESKNKILVFGNGGSASDAQHIVAELVGRYKSNRVGFPAIALSANTSILTSIGNDFGFERLFERQVEALANSGDLLIGISTSGNSQNVINALKKGRELGCKSIGLSGCGGGAMSSFCDINVTVPSDDTPRIQEMHILIGHIISQAVDEL